MTVAIPQQINFLNQILYSDTAWLYPNEYVYSDDSKFNNISGVYLEVVAKNSDSSSKLIYFSVDGGANIGFVSVPASTSQWELFRSTDVKSPFITNAPAIFELRITGTTSEGQLEIKSAKIIILQSATDITDTQTQIEVGQYGVMIPAVVDTWYAIPQPKYWKYEADKWDPTPTFKFGFTMAVEDNKETYIIGLQEASDAAFTSDLSYITASQVTVNTETATYYESSNFTPTDGYFYRVVYQGDDYKDEIYLYNAKVIATQVALEISYIDDNDGAGTVYGTSAGQPGQGAGQSFTTVDAFALSGISFIVDKLGSPTDNFYCVITSALLGDTPITNGTSDTIAGADIPADAEWLEFVFSTPPSLSATTQYYAKLYRSGSYDSSNAIMIGYCISPAYGDGTYIYKTTTNNWNPFAYDASFKVKAATPTSPITKLQPEYLLINAAQTDTGLQEFMIDWDPDEWEGVDNVYWHEHSADSAGSNTKLEVFGDESNLEENTSYSGYVWLFGGTGTNEAVGQSFQLDEDAVLTKIQLLLLENESCTDNLYVSITSSLGGTPIVTSPDVSGDIGASEVWVEFDVSGGNRLSGLTTYYIELYRDGARDTFNMYEWKVSAADPYADGMKHSKASGLWSDNTGVDGAFKVFGQFLIDLTNSDITGDDLTRGGTALTMPATAKEIDVNIITA